VVGGQGWFLPPRIFFTFWLSRRLAGTRAEPIVATLRAALAGREKIALMLIGAVAFGAVQSRIRPDILVKITLLQQPEDAPKRSKRSPTATVALKTICLCSFR